MRVKTNSAVSRQARSPSFPIYLSLSSFSLSPRSLSLLVLSLSSFSLSPRSLSLLVLSLSLFPLFPCSLSLLVISLPLSRISCLFVIILLERELWNFYLSIILLIVLYVIREVNVIYRYWISLGYY